MQTPEHFIPWKLRADALFSDIYLPLVRCAPHKACPMKAISVLLSADTSVTKPVFQAVTSCFRMFPDTVEGSTHFSYVFDHATAVAQISSGLFPEMHYWVFDEASGWVIDTSAVDQPTQAKDMLGVEWGKEFSHMPPFAVKHKDIDDDLTVYQADPNAIAVGLNVLRNLHQEIGLNVPMIRRIYGH